MHARLGFGYALTLATMGACGATERGGSTDTATVTDTASATDTATITDTAQATETATVTDTDVATEVAADGDADASTCQGLFGQPNERTGLTSDQCKPTCACDGSAPWSPPTYDAAFVADLRTWELTTPYAIPASDPYAEGATTIIDDLPDAVCAVVPAFNRNGPRQYRLENYLSEAAAHEAGAFPTHNGHCGVCSTLGNLAVYISQPDLTEPVRQCGLTGMAQGKAANVACLEALGFDAPCAEIWYYNTLHTRQACLEPCLGALDEPYHTPDGALNACLQCDEAKSGPVFKTVAGRTRRNSGLANAMCRPCAEVRPLVHDYPSL